MNMTLTNDFHNTEVTIRVRELPHMITQAITKAEKCKP